MRVLLFLLTNIAIMVLLYVVAVIFGVANYLDETGTGLDLQALLIFCLILGMGGSAISLLISKWIAKMSTRAKVIDKPKNQNEQWLVDTVRELAEEAGIGMPEVAIFPAEQANAFATGWNRNNALVAVSAGMLQRFPKEEVKAVMAHEIGHVANGDMVTMSLIQGVLNTFVLFIARVIAFAVDRVIFKNDSGYGIGYIVVTIVMQIVLGILASMIVMWFSRRREFRADAWGAALGSQAGMINALQRLKAESGMPDQMPENLNAFGINSGKRSGIQAMFMSHPPIDQRIKALKESN